MTEHKHSAGDTTLNESVERAFGLLVDVLHSNPSISQHAYYVASINLAARLAAELEVGADHWADYASHTFPAQVQHVRDNGPMFVGKVSK